MLKKLLDDTNHQKTFRINLAIGDQSVLLEVLCFFLWKLQYSDAYSLYASKSFQWLTEAFRRHKKDTT